MKREKEEAGGCYLSFDLLNEALPWLIVAAILSVRNRENAMRLTTKRRGRFNVWIVTSWNGLIMYGMSKSDLLG